MLAMNGGMDAYYGQPQHPSLGPDGRNAAIPLGMRSEAPSANPFGPGARIVEQQDNRYYDDALLQDQDPYGQPSNIHPTFPGRNNGPRRSTLTGLHASSGPFLTIQSDLPMQPMDYALTNSGYPNDDDEYSINLSAISPQQHLPFSDQYTSSSAAYSIMSPTDPLMAHQHHLSPYDQSGTMHFADQVGMMHSDFQQQDLDPGSSHHSELTPQSDQSAMSRAISRQQIPQAAGSLQGALPTRHPTLQSMNSGNSSAAPVKDETLGTPTSGGMLGAASAQGTGFTGSMMPDPQDGVRQQGLSSGEQTGSDALSQNLSSVPIANNSFEGIYSTSGFDMMDILTKVATRPNPQINIGPVDMSCSFVVCDATKFDTPIIYCSDMFERLTGYSKHEIIGRNCRFLQSPDGRVQPGVARKYVDDEVIWQLKKAISRTAEAQTGLINYRKGGQPFMNMLTTIPIFGDGEHVKWYVGLQIDLVEHPGSIQDKKSDGSISVNYQRALLPNYKASAPTRIDRPVDQGLTIGRDDVSAVLSTIGTGDSELSKRLWDKILLENTDDVVHVLSLKGLFLYLSPSSRKVLEYQPDELIGKSISSVCHPSDIIPVTRDLKDTTGDSAVSIVYRVRRKHSGYTWFESHGCLHTEQGKGRKCIILVGRERPVYTLQRKEIEVDGGIGDNELWSKLSTSAMFLFVSSNSRSLLDRSPDDLLGTSMQTLMRPDSKQELGKALEIVRGGHRATVKHELHHRQGQVLQVETVLFPGDATAGQKPTFIVARTKFVRASRSKHALAAAARRKSSGIVPTAPGTGSADGVASSSHSGPHGLQELDRIETVTGSNALAIGSQDVFLASEENVFDELKTTRSTSWQFELRQMQRANKRLSEELQTLISARKKRKRRKGAMELEKDCANCHTRITSEWRRGPSGFRDLCNSCGLRYAKSQNGRAGSGKGSQGGGSISPVVSIAPDQRMQFSSSSKPEQMPSIDAQVQSSSPSQSRPALPGKRSTENTPTDSSDPILFKPPSLLSALSQDSSMEPP